MSISGARQEANSRFQEAQNFLSLIKSQEKEARSSIPTDLNIQKGLFLVLLYGSFEYAVTKMVSEAMLIINSRKIPLEYAQELFYPLALSAELDAVTTSGQRTKWEKRVALFERAASNVAMELKEGCLQSELSNLWSRSVSQIFKLFCIPNPPLYDVRVKQYIDELVEKRNSVAHGRESAAIVGQAYTADRLQILLNEVVKQSQYIFLEFDEILGANSFVRLPHRSKY